MSTSRALNAEILVLLQVIAKGMFEPPPQVVFLSCPGRRNFDEFHSEKLAAAATLVVNSHWYIKYHNQDSPTLQARRRIVGLMAALYVRIRGHASAGREEAFRNKQSTSENESRPICTAVPSLIRIKPSEWVHIDSMNLEFSLWPK
jgi:hypothetical protein